VTACLAVKNFKQGKDIEILRYWDIEILGYWDIVIAGKSMGLRI